MSAATHAAPGNTVPHCLKARFVLMIERSVTAADNDVENIRSSAVARDVAALVEDQDVGPDVATDAALERGK
jgi:hypothetical protein